MVPKLTIYVHFYIFTLSEYYLQTFFIGAGSILLVYSLPSSRKTVPSKFACTFCENDHHPEFHQYIFDLHLKKQAHLKLSSQKCVPFKEQLIIIQKKWYDPKNKVPKIFRICTMKVKTNWNRIDHHPEVA